MDYWEPDLLKMQTDCKGREGKIRQITASVSEAAGGVDISAMSGWPVGFFLSAFQTILPGPRQQVIFTLRWCFSC